MGCAGWFGTGGRIYDWWHAQQSFCRGWQIIERNNPQAQPAEEPEAEEEPGEGGEEGEEGVGPKKMPRLSPDEPVFLTTYYEFRAI